MGVALAVKFALAFMTPLTPDESLHWMQGHNLAWGFRDHPPVTAFLSFLSRTAFGVSTPSARLFAILSTTACSLIAFGILKEAGFSEKTACRGGVLTQLVPMFAFGFIMVPVFPFAAIIFAAEYFFVRALRTGRLSDHLLWGLVLGISSLSYYITVTAVFGMLVFCIIDGRGRECVSSGRFWAGVAAAGVVASPNVWWNLSQGKDSAVWFQLVERSPYAFRPDFFLAFLAISVLIAGPIILNAAIRTPKSLSGRGALFAVLFVVPLAGFLLLSLVREAGAHWAVVAFLNAPLVAAARGEERSHSRWWTGTAVGYASLILVILFTGLILDPQSWVQQYDPDGALVGRRRTRSYFDSRETALKAREWKLKLAEEGIETSFVTDKWGTAGVLSFYTPGHPYYYVFPDPPRHGQDYTLWNRHSPPSKNVIFVKSAYRFVPAVRNVSKSMKGLWSSGPKGRPTYVLYLCRGFSPPPPGEGPSDEKEER